MKITHNYQHRSSRESHTFSEDLSRARDLIGNALETRPMTPKPKGSRSLEEKLHFSRVEIDNRRQFAETLGMY